MTLYMKTNTRTRTLYMKTNTRTRTLYMKTNTRIKGTLHEDQRKNKWDFT